MNLHNDETERVLNNRKKGSGMKGRIWIIIGGVVLSIVILAGLLSFPRYQHEMKDARTKLALGSSIIQTASGLIEYADIGQGYPVLVIHGAGGGFDQGIFLARTFIGDDFRWIIPSRFGYLNSPVLSEGSAAVQADVYADLLDALKIKQVAIVGVSDGGPSTLQFSLRHPDRVSSMVMMAAKSHTPPKETFLQKTVFSTIFRSDFLYWSITTYLRSFLLSMFGVSKEVQAELSPADREKVDEFLESMHPMSLRKAGIYNDRATLSGESLNQAPLSKITPPVLVVHAVDDFLQPISHGEYTAQNIPGAKFLRFQSGGHLLTGHFEEVKKATSEFIRQNVQKAEE